MASKTQLNPEILQFLHVRLDKPISTIRTSISVLKRDHPTSTLNAVAQIYAEQHGESVRRFISKEDKLSLPSRRIEKPVVIRTRQKGNSKEKIKIIIQFETANPFLKKHIDEINRAYTKHCYTCVFILSRKVFENIIIEILRQKYPANPELYFDIKKYRNLDFSTVLETLYQKRHDFDFDRRQAIERLHQKLKPFKNDANDKTHSLYHIVENADEVESWNLNTTIDLLRRIM